MPEAPTWSKELHGLGYRTVRSDRTVCNSTWPGALHGQQAPYSPQFSSIHLAIRQLNPYGSFVSAVKAAMSVHDLGFHYALHPLVPHGIVNNLSVILRM
jgi:hypothetical protein